MNYLLGVDWYANGNWTLTGQFSQKMILLYEEHLTFFEYDLDNRLITKTYADSSSVTFD